MPKTKPTVHVIVKYFFPVAAGIETNIMETYSVLAKEGWEVVIHTSRDTLTEHEVLPEQEMIRGLQVKRYTWKKWGFTPQFEVKTGDLVALHNFNIVPHFQVMFKALLDTFRRTKNYTLVLTPHGGFTPEWPTFPFLQRVVKRFYHQTLGSWMINLSVDGVRAVSEWEKEEMMKHGLRGRKIKVIDNGIENLAFSNYESAVTAETKKRVTSWGKYLIDIARIHPIKNVETIIKALPLVPKDINFVMVGPIGDQAYLDSLQALAKSLQVSDRVIFAGVIRGADKFYVLRQARMMVHMAVWESYCNAVHEGMSQGLVCLVADNTALPYLVKNGKNGYTLPTTDHVLLANRITDVDTNFNNQTLKTLRARTAEWVTGHSWDKVAYRMADWYQGLGGRNAR